MEHVKEPMFCDEPFTLKFPVAPEVSFCSCCLSLALPKVRGIPKTARPLPEAERDELLRNLQGNWKIQPLSAANVQYTDACVQDSVMMVSGGMHNVRVNHGGAAGSGHTHQVAAGSVTQRQPLNFFRGQNGELYCDNTGSMFTRVDFAGGEIEIDNSINYKLLLQRGWKRDGLPPPQQVMGEGTGITGEVSVVNGPTDNVAGDVPPQFVDGSGPTDNVAGDAPPQFVYGGSAPTGNAAGGAPPTIAYGSGPAENVYGSGPSAMVYGSVR